MDRRLDGKTMPVYKKRAAFLLVD